MLIAILGPDGTGKTTLAKALADKITRLNYIYFGYNKESRDYKYFDLFMKSEPRNILERTARKGLQVLNDLAVFRSAKRSHIIADRCPIDRFINTKIQRRILRYYYYFILKISPHPHFVILLDGDSKIIFNRKKEISESHIKHALLYYKEYLIKNKINHILIDTTKNDIDQTYSIAINTLENQLL